MVKGLLKKGAGLCLASLIITPLCFGECQITAASTLDDTSKDKEDYRNYDETVPIHVRDFYYINHCNQTLDFVLKKKSEYLPLNKGKMGIWDAFELLDTLVDESDPDLDLPQSYHLFQTAEALRKDNHPRWLILTGLIHDLGKMLAFYGEPHWAVVGDTFPVGCRISDKVIFSEFFRENPDSSNPVYQTLYGIYKQNCGLDNLHMSWGHDEYLYHVVKHYLPEPASSIIRYHSFYAAHQQGEYSHLMNEKDRQTLYWLKLFQKYDLYSKSPEKLDIQALKPYYEELVAEFFPEKLDW